MPRRCDVTDAVYKVLEAFPKARDDNYVLIGFVLQEFTDCELTLLELASDHYDLPTLESITRISRILQRAYPHLRGARYEKRHKKEEDYEELNREEVEELEKDERPI